MGRPGRCLVTAEKPSSAQATRQKSPDDRPGEPPAEPAEERPGDRPGEPPDGPAEEPRRPVGGAAKRPGGLPGMDRRTCPSGD